MTSPACSRIPKGAFTVLLALACLWPALVLAQADAGQESDASVSSDAGPEAGTQDSPDADPNDLMQMQRINEDLTDAEKRLEEIKALLKARKVKKAP